MKTSVSLFRFATLLASLCLPVLFTGCAVMDPGSMQSDLNRIKNSQNALSSKQSDAFLEQQRKLNEIIDQLNVQQEMVKNLKADLEKQLRELRATTPATPGSQVRAGGAAAPMPGEPPATAGVATPAEDALLRQSADLYTKKDYRKTLESTEQFLTQYPDSANTPEVLLRQAYSYFNLENYAKGLETCNTFIGKFPTSSLLPRAYHTKGVCEIKLQKRTEARETLTKLRNQFPDYDPERIKQLFADELDKK
ncbi:TPA: hypothetical protein DDW35_11765 [Candidatus Sumerlaeota bacterium]|jgi:TolA-binding protein|nr:hypothetical protein [Candidatus Sumerlaeota bacterium]